MHLPAKNTGVVAGVMAELVTYMRMAMCSAIQSDRHSINIRKNVAKKACKYTWHEYSPSRVQQVEHQILACFATLLTGFFYLQILV